MTLTLTLTLTLPLTLTRCVESACALDAVRLAPQAEWAATMDIVPKGATQAKPEAPDDVTVGGSWGR